MTPQGQLFSKNVFGNVVDFLEITIINHNHYHDDDHDDHAHDHDADHDDGHDHDHHDHEAGGLGSSGTGPLHRELKTLIILTPRIWCVDINYYDLDMLVFDSYSFDVSILIVMVLAWPY